MKKLHLLFPLIFLLLIVQFGCGSDPKNQLIGKWKDSSSNSYYEFMDSGSFTKTGFSTTDGKWYLTNGKDNGGKDVNYLMLEYSNGEKKSMKINSITATGLDIENENGQAYHLDKL